MKKKYKTPTIKSETFAMEMMQAACEHNGGVISATANATSYTSTGGCNCHEDSTTSS